MLVVYTLPLSWCVTLTLITLALKLPPTLHPNWTWFCASLMSSHILPTPSELLKHITVITIHIIIYTYIMCIFMRLFSCHSCNFPCACQHSSRKRQCLTILLLLMRRSTWLCAMNCGHYLIDFSRLAPNQGNALV